MATLMNVDPSTAATGFNFSAFIQRMVDSIPDLLIQSNNQATIFETNPAPFHQIVMTGNNFMSVNPGQPQPVFGMTFRSSTGSVFMSVTNMNVQMLQIYNAVHHSPAELVALLGDINFTGAAGNDVMEFGGGDDSAHGGAGNDTFYGRAGQDALFGEGGNDFIDGGSGVDFMNGGDGFDTVSYLSSTLQGVTLYLPGQGFNAGAANLEVVHEFEAYYLTNNNEVDRFDGTDASEYIYGFAGVDYINGNGGSDFIDAGAGADVVNGGGGFDYFSWNTSAGVVVNMLNPAANTGHAAGDAITNFEAFYLSEFNDVFVGQNGANIVFGQAGSDSLFGGNSSNDWLFGGDGVDFLSGGTLNDLLSGGAGNDTYAFVNYATNGLDQVLDFTSGGDRIQLSGAGFGLGAGATFSAGFNFIASAAPLAVVAGGTLLYNTANGFLSYDIDGTGGQAAIALAQFSGAPLIQASDFVVV